MIEIAKHIDGDGIAPEYLRYAWTSDRYGSPFSGGWMDWPAGFVVKMDYAKLVYNTLASYTESGVYPTDETRQYIVDDYILLDSFTRTGNIPDASDDNDFRERTLAFKRLLDD